MKPKDNSCSFQLSTFSSSQSLLEIAGDGRNLNDVSGSYNPNFDLFTFDAAEAKRLSTFAPMTAPFGDYVADQQAQVLLYQRIGRVDTKYPLLMFKDQSGVKNGVLAAEGIWKWKLYDFLDNESHDLFNTLISKTVQYLTI